MLEYRKRINGLLDRLERELATGKLNVKQAGAILVGIEYGLEKGEFSNVRQIDFQAARKITQRKTVCSLGRRDKTGLRW
jgi:hypothetical protein